MKPKPLCKGDPLYESEIKAAVLYLKKLMIEDGDLIGYEPIQPSKQKKGCGCCYCRDCGYHNDDCVCNHNDLLKQFDEAFPCFKEEK